MTRHELKSYLISIQSGGLAQDVLGNIAESAIEAGFSAVWGAHYWKIRTAQNNTLTTTASQAYTTLPKDLESLNRVVVVSGNRSRYIDLVDASAFDMDHPSPVALNTNIPVRAKMVFDTATSIWWLYWFPIPDGTYTLNVSYDRKPDSNMMSQLPSHMVPAVVEMCTSFMVGGAEDRLARLQVANSHLARAIQADRIISGFTPQYGQDYGWNDGFASGGSSRGQTEWWPGAQL